MKVTEGARSHAATAPAGAARPPARAEQLVLDTSTARLCDAVGDGSHAPARLAMIAAGQYGKTALLGLIEDVRHRSALPVRRYRQDRLPTSAEGTLLLVDDAHELNHADVEALHEYLADERVGMIVAARPRPRPTGLDTLLGKLHGQIVLRPFDRARTGQYLANTRRMPCDPEFIEFVCGQTGGVPGLVSELVWAHESDDVDGAPAADRCALPTTFTRTGHELDRLPTATMRLLLAAEAGADPRFEPMAELLDCAQEDVAEVIESARATGLFTVDGELLPFGAHAVRTVVPADRRVAVRQRLAALAVRNGQPVLPMVRGWLGSRVTGSAVADAFAVAAEEALPDEPAVSCRLFGAAVEAGKELVVIAARWAEAAVFAGDLDTALRLAEKALASTGRSTRVAAARVAGVVLAQRGHPRRSAELFEWSGTAQSCAFAAVGLACGGHTGAADRALRTAESAAEPPSVLTGAVLSMARGVRESLTASPSGALSELVSSAEMLEAVGNDALLPESPAALAATVAVHCGEPAVAESALRRAMTSEVAGGTFARRHRLLLAWLAMLRGDLDSAADGLGRAGEPGTPRDRLFAVALEVGIARRASDVAALRRAWPRAREVVVRQTVDLHALLPFGELAVAAALLGEHDRLEPHLRPAHELLDELGEPALWAGLPHWHLLHAALTAQRHERAREHAATLRRHAEQLPYCDILATAADCWLRALDGDVPAAEVRSAARDLRDVGMCWDGGRLAGQAAIHTSDRADMRALLDCARQLQGAQPATERTPVTAGGDTDRLSEREREVAELVITGLTYKEVGARLFISAKTVEHHMARMRQRLGAANRTELLGRLRALLAA